MLNFVFPKKIHFIIKHNSILQTSLSSNLINIKQYPEISETFPPTSKHT